MVWPSSKNGQREDPKEAAPLEANSWKMKAWATKNNVARPNIHIITVVFQDQALYIV